MSRNKDKHNVGELDFEEFKNFLDSQVFSVHDMLLIDIENYNMYYNKFYRYMKQGFERKEVRTYPIKYTFTSNPIEPVKTMEIREMIGHMIFWKAFIKIDRVKDINSSHLIDFKHLTKERISNFIDTMIIDPYRKLFSNKKMSRMVNSINNAMKDISDDFNPIMGMSISIESFIKVSKEVPRFNEIIRTRVDPNMQAKEIERLQHELMVEEIEILSTHDNCLKPILQSGTGIKDKQLAEFSIIGGLKPDVNGNVIPVPINSNFLIGGLNNVTNYYVDSQAGRKSVILNKTSMGTSGYFAAKCMMSSSTVHLSKQLIHDINHKKVSKHVQTCNSKRPILYIVKDKNCLKKINRRYYYLNSDMYDMRCVNYKTDKWLIGKTIYLRSPITCTCEDGICNACYGDLAYTNSEESFNIGAYASALLNNTIQQNILSTKHLLTTNSEELIFSDEFYKFFVLDASKFKLDQDSKENFDDWIIRIYDDDLFEFNAKEESDFNSYTDKFYLVNKKTKEEIEIKELNNNLDMYIYSDIMSLFKKSREKEAIEMPLNKIDAEDMYLAIIIIENNELTRPLKNIMRLLDRKDHYGCETIDEIVNKMSDLIIECGHKIDLVHTEVIMRSIVKDKNAILTQPHFDDINRKEDYQILTISNALYNNSSLSVSLSFQDLGKQVVNPNTNIKCEKSSYDDLYRESLS